MKTAVVILNWNTREFLRRWLPGLIESCKALGTDPETGEDLAEVVVADSASTDGSMEMMAEEFPGVRTIPLDANYGFTGGYNKALAKVDAEYFVLINSDIEVGPDWLGPLVEWMDTHPDCGVCGPKLHALDCLDKDATAAGARFSRTERFEYAGAAGGLIDRFGYPFCRGRVLGRTEMDEGQYDSPADVLWTSGACMMTRSSLWRGLGGLDDRFFAHMEEIDYCWRAQLAGWKVSVVPASVVWHLGGGTLPQTSPFKLKLNFRNGLMLLENNLPGTFMAGGLSWKKAIAKARRRIRFRKFLDLGSALVYLLGGKKDFAAAVLQAHREYDGLSKGLRTDAGTHMPSGLSGICIIPQAALRKEKIFKYIREHENRH